MKTLARFRIKNFKYRFFYFLLITSIASLNNAYTNSPNIIIIFTDDQGYHDLGIYGSSTIATPNIDQMAKNGIRFTNFYVASPVCTPSRAGLLTGRYPRRFGMDKGVIFPESTGGLPPSEETIAELVKKKGYATLCVGKWHLGHTPGHLPTDQGFDHYYGIPYSNDMYISPDLKLSNDLLLRDGMTEEEMKRLGSFRKLNSENRHIVPLMRDEEVIEFPADQGTLTKRYTEEAIKFIENNKDRSFFIYLAHTMPHIPLFTSEEFVGKSKGGAYGDTIEEIDWSVGQILNCLNNNKLNDNTLVVFTSDNGPWLIMGDQAGSASPLRNGKSSTFEGGVRVPCIITLPNTIPPNVTSHEVTSTLDLLPTIASIVNATPENKMDGVDLTPHLYAPTNNPVDMRPMLYYHQSGNLSAIRLGSWKLIFSKPVNRAAQKKEAFKYPKDSSVIDPELYNLDEDMGEQNNLASVFPDKVNQLLAVAKEYDSKITP